VAEYKEQIFKNFGVSVSIHPFASTMAHELLKTNKTEQAIELLKEQINSYPTDINLFTELLVQVETFKFSFEYTGNICQMIFLSPFSMANFLFR
jgi:hypothetical protein